MNTIRIIFLLITIICLVWLAFVVRKNKQRGDYDERQTAIRNRGYKYGFITMIVIDIILIYFKYSITVDLAITIPLFSGAFVVTAYDVAKGAYFRMTEKHPLRGAWTTLILGIIEAALAWISFDPKDINYSATMIMMAIYVLVIGVEAVFIGYRDLKEK